MILVMKLLLLVGMVLVVAVLAACAFYSWLLRDVELATEDDEGVLR